VVAAAEAAESAESDTAPDGTMTPLAAAALVATRGLSELAAEAGNLEEAEALACRCGPQQCT
jgi:hypothetical protein